MLDDLARGAAHYCQIGKGARFSQTHRQLDSNRGRIGQENRSQSIVGELDRLGVWIIQGWQFKHFAVDQLDAFSTEHAHFTGEVELIATPVVASRTAWKDLSD
jgi:hypothetical protein